ncbi:hypothetical protein Tsubulata_040423 [Turnera subulata]|uniref:Uncharacterized protein n=1 Tax=Turnera subulata TaxID=218843 RepID=A0A9Q0FUC8_9ROSI|nr:hypothetical protein Tsubulata_040423 [Turnera subulata]
MLLVIFAITTNNYYTVKRLTLIETDGTDCLGRAMLNNYTLLQKLFLGVAVSFVTGEDGEGASQPNGGNAISSQSDPVPNAVSSTLSSVIPRREEFDLAL